MALPLISVIVPVYNQENTLSDTLEGIISQTYENLEIILVNDGSTDNSLRVCEEYEKKDNRITIITQDNKGLSGARNTGINNSHGEYCSFIDAGDFVSKDLFSYMEKYIQLGVELIDYPYLVLGDSGISDPVLNKLEKNTIYDREIIEKEWLPCLLNLTENTNELAVCFVWRFLFKTSVIKDNHIYYDEHLRKWEDREYIINYLDKCNNVVFTDKANYTYDCRTTVSHLSFYFYDNILDVINLLKGREKRFSNKYSFDSDYYYNHCAKVVFERLYDLFSNAPELLPKKYEVLFQDDFIINIINRWKPQDKRFQDLKQVFLTKDTDLFCDKFNKIYLSGQPMGFADRLKEKIKRLMKR